MDRKKRRNLRLSKALPAVDLKETEALIELLFEATKQNSSYCCRLLNISRPTWKKWITDTPTEWYWPLVLRTAIKHTIASTIAHRRASSMIFQNRVRNALSSIPNSRDYEEEIVNLAYDIRGAQAHLRDLLTPRGRWWSDIQKAANLGGYTKQTIRKAAKSLGVVKKQEGYGADKDSYWRLPTEEED